jgi:hypothetical protein
MVQAGVVTAEQERMPRQRTAQNFLASQLRDDGLEFLLPFCCSL